MLATQYAHLAALSSSRLAFTPGGVMSSFLAGFPLLGRRFSGSCSLLGGSSSDGVASMAGSVLPPKAALLSWLKACFACLAARLSTLGKVSTAALACPVTLHRPATWCGLTGWSSASAFGPHWLNWPPVLRARLSRFSSQVTELDRFSSKFLC